MIRGNIKVKSQLISLFLRLSHLPSFLLIVFSIISLSTSQSNLQKVSRIPAKIAQVKVVCCI